MQMQCIICRDGLNVSVGAVATYCGHIFHNDCINQWLARSGTCPVCRTPVVKMNLKGIVFHDISDDVKKSSENIQNQINIIDFELMEKKKKIEDLKDRYKSSSRDFAKSFKKQDGMLQHFIDVSTELKVLQGMMCTSLQLNYLKEHLRNVTLHLKNAQTVLEGSMYDTKTIMKNVKKKINSAEEKNVSNRIAAYCCEMKKELIHLKKESNRLQNKLMRLKRNTGLVHADSKKKRQKKQNFKVLPMNSVSESELPCQSPFPIIRGLPDDLSLYPSVLVSTLSCWSSGENRVYAESSNSRNDADLRQPESALRAISTGVRYNHPKAVNRKE